MLEKMLCEVEQQEKLFSLDLDVLDREEQCINTLELVPSTDAIIEIPIKKSMKVPKTYETTHEINISDDPSDKDDNYELVAFVNPQKKVPKQDEYDLIDFGDDSKKSTSDLDKIQDSVTRLLMEVENDEAEMLLQNIAKDDYLETIQFDNIKKYTASSEESIKDSESSSSSDSWEDQNNIQDYEPIDTHVLTSKFLSRDIDNPGAYLSDIWYEGTYRNLSIVPEEDEENVSLIGSASNKSGSSRNYAPFKNYEPISTSYFFPHKDSKHSSFELTDSDSSEYSQEKIYLPPQEKIIKAEIKLLVKTVEHGKEAIEIRSVREFVDPPQRSDDYDFNKKSKTLPIRRSKREPFSKKYSDSCFDIRSSITGETPVFTLPRVFIRTTEDSVKDPVKNRNELIATPSSNFPLHSNSYQNNYTTKQNNKDIDLFANAPFFPCYKSPSLSPTEIFKHSSKMPKAYCDWLPENYGTKGKVLIFPC